MAIPINDSTLDKETRGMPFVNTATSVLEMGSLDYEGRGLPYWSQPLLIVQDACVITITAPLEECIVVPRKFPLKRQEMAGETQVKRINPIIGAQYAQYLP